MFKSTKTLLVVSALFAASFSSSLFAQEINEINENNVCRDAGIAVGFFNGVQNTLSDANRALLELRRIHKEETESGELIKYEVFYNYSEGFEDFVETFEQRLQEQEGILQGRYELFLEAMAGDGPWWSSIIDRVGATANILDGFVDWTQAATVDLLASPFGNPPTTVAYAEHKTRIDTLILEGKQLLFIAHSQGNLFVNGAYNYATASAEPNSVKVVHIAPASPTLNGSYTLADLDLVINGLRLAGSVPSVTSNIPGYLLRPAGLNGLTDIIGHGLVEIYINPALSISNRVKTHINDALSELAANVANAPEAQASLGFFAATLIWDGSGDVDLHTFEPGGSHVYYRSKVGQAGFLDVDNVNGFGPEHYYASCDPTKLQTGVYTISVANYEQADGRTATVQIANWNDGVLGTKSETMGAATRDEPAYEYFKVDVSQDSDSGIYTAKLVQ